MNNSETKKSYVVTIGSAVLALAFIGAGGSKLAGAAVHIESFEKFGLPLWFMYVTGAIEVGAALLLLLRDTRFLAATTLVGTMIGAVGVHLLAGDPFTQSMPALVLLVAVSAVAWATRNQLAPLLGRLGLRSASPAH